ncbi:hypothetical protein Ancab_010239 [Ancistrocladus abbreviatus]
MLVSTSHSGLIAHSLSMKVNGQMFLIRVNKEISGESLYFPGEDCRPDRGINIDSSHGSLSSPTVGGESGDLLGHKIGNTQMLSENPVIGNITESLNDDNPARNPRLTADGGERNQVAGRRVEREEYLGVQGAVRVDSAAIMIQGPIDSQMQAGIIAYPDTSPRELTQGCAFLDPRPACSIKEEDIGLTHSLGKSVFSRAEGRATCLG